MDIPTFSLDMGALRKTEAPDPEKTYDLIIVGGGPASMSAAVYAARKMISLAIITKDYGGQVRETSAIENYLGFQNVNAEDLVSRFEEHVGEFKIPASVGTAVTKIDKEKDRFKVHCDDGNVYQASSLVLCTGTRHRKLEIPGEKELTGKGVAYCATCDAPFFKNKNVVVAGGGNSAFTTALDLAKVNARIAMVNFARGWNADQALQARVRSDEKTEFLDNHQVVRIEGADRVKAIVVKNRDSGEERSIAADGLFIEIGLQPNSDMVKGLVKMSGPGEVIVDCACRTSVPGLFAAGDVSTVPYKQIIISAGEGAKAALAAHQYLVDHNLA